MMNLGLIEYLIILVVGVLTFAVPLATLVFLYLIYDRVRRIEDLLRSRQ